MVDYATDAVGGGQPPPEPQMSVKQYALTRFSTLKPPMRKTPNPIRILMLLNGKQWLFFLLAFSAWVGRIPGYHRRITANSAADLGRL